MPFKGISADGDLDDQDSPVPAVQVRPDRDIERPRKRQRRDTNPAHNASTPQERGQLAPILANFPTEVIFVVCVLFSSVGARDHQLTH